MEEKHWADVIAEDLLKLREDHKIATGITPSGPIHIGNLREMLTADAIRRAIIDKGGEAEIVYVADTFDPLRRRYPFLPKEYEEYVGMPLSLIPDPEGCHDNYAEHFLQPFLESLEILEIPVVVKKADEMYRNGEYEEVTKISLQQRDNIARILEEVTGRKIESDWYPFMPLCKNCKRLTTTKIVSFDDKRIRYVCSCGDEGEVSYREGKLVWRVDWPARWRILGITCEPFGKDHASAGGSYDTGKRLAREVFGIEPPYPVPYEWVHLKGVGAMSSSKGVVIPVREFIEILPPEIVRYIIIRVKPKKHIEFDPANLLELVDEFEEGLKAKDRSVELAMISGVEYSDVPFRHLIVVGQIAKWDVNKALEIIARTGYTVDEKTKRDVERRLKYAKRWLESFASERLKFEIAEKVDKSLFNDEELKFLKNFAERLSEEMSAEDIHNTVYAVANEIGIKPAKAFQAIYKAILGKTYGPRAGYFIKTLGVEWFKKRIQELA